MEWGARTEAPHIIAAVADIIVAMAAATLEQEAIAVVPVGDLVAAVPIAVVVAMAVATLVLVGEVMAVAALPEELAAAVSQVEVPAAAAADIVNCKLIASLR